MMKNVMAINMGLKSIRCIIFNQNGLKLGSAALAINTAISDKQVEQNPQERWEKAKVVMQKALTEADSVEISYITVTTSASCLVSVDKEGNPLGKALMISGKRESKKFMKNKEFTSYFEGVYLSEKLLEIAKKEFK